MSTFYFIYNITDCPTTLAGGLGVGFGGSVRLTGALPFAFA